MALAGAVVVGAPSKQTHLRGVDEEGAGRVARDFGQRGSDRVRVDGPAHGPRLLTPDELPGSERRGAAVCCDPMQLRPADLADLELLRRWDDQPHVIDADPNDDWEWEREFARTPPWREQLVAEVDGRPIGFLQIIDPAAEETHYWGDCPPNLRALDIWIGEASDLGKGFGTRMMELALERCFGVPEVDGVLVDPLFDNAGARRFYERCGFRFVERRQFGADDCAVYRLDRAAWEERRREKVGA